MPGYEVRCLREHRYAVSEEAVGTYENLREHQGQEPMRIALSECNMCKEEMEMSEQVDRLGFETSPIQDLLLSLNL